MTVVRNINILNHFSPEGHCEIRFENVRVPVENLLGTEGDGFMMAQARLGPAASIIACARSANGSRLRSHVRPRAGAQDIRRHLAERDTILEWIARSRVSIEQARLLVLKNRMDDRSGWCSERTQGNLHDQDIDSANAV